MPCSARKKNTALLKRLSDLIIENRKGYNVELITVVCEKIDIDNPVYQVAKKWES